jgi:hypothetical protein
MPNTGMKRKALTQQVLAEENNNDDGCMLSSTSKLVKIHNHDIHHDSSRDDNRKRDNEEEENDGNYGDDDESEYEDDDDGEDEGDGDGDLTTEQHIQLVAAIFEIGLKHSSPSVILENMTQTHELVNSEKVKSKLQKYRNNKKKYKQEFMDEYESFLDRIKSLDSAGVFQGASQQASAMNSVRDTMDPAVLLDRMGSTQTRLLGGDVPGYLTYAVKNERKAKSNATGESSHDGTILSSPLLQKGVMDLVRDFAGVKIPFPKLTDDEKKTPLGIAMTFVMGLFLSMSQHLRRERAGGGVNDGSRGSGNSAIGGNVLDLKLPPVDVGALLASAATSGGVAMVRGPASTAATMAREMGGQHQPQVFEALTALINQQPSMSHLSGDSDCVGSIHYDNNVNSTSSQWGTRRRF